jgi:hypothetical protein
MKFFAIMCLLNPRLNWKFKLKILDEANKDLINDNKEDMTRNLKMKHTYDEV